VPRGVNGAVNHEARRIHGERRFADFLALQIDLHQAGGGDLVEEHPVGVDEELILGPGHPDGDVREDEILPAEVRHQPVAGRKVDTHSPFLGRDLVLEGRNHGGSFRVKIGLARS
jgi:hypothetical protein